MKRCKKYCSPEQNPSIRERQCLWSHFKPLAANLSPKSSFSWPEIPFSFELCTSVSSFSLARLGRRKQGERCKWEKQFLSILGRDHCFSYLGPQHSSVISFTTNRGQLLYPLMGKFLAKFSLEYLVCTRSYKLYPQHVCFVVSQSFFFF